MTQPPARDALYDALLSMKTRAEIDAFLADLCTPAELRAFAERWQVARLLDAGGRLRHGLFHYAVTMERSRVFVSSPLARRGTAKRWRGSHRPIDASDAERTPPSRR